MKIFVTGLLLIFTGCASSSTLFEGHDREALFVAKCQNPGPQVQHQLLCTGVAEVAGRKEGLWCCFDADHHLLMASEFRDGLKNGRTELYSGADGHLETISTWKSGHLEGAQINFNRNGTPLDEYALHDNRFNGEMKDYDSNGELLSIHHYQNGFCLDPDHVADEHNN